MGVIKEIEIKNFRSIDTLIIKEENIRNLNILVGSNDIGKSNVLRALNLFFNGETDMGKKFDFNTDFNKNKERLPGKGQYVLVKLKIEVLYEKDKYVIWTKKWGANSLLEKDDEWKLFTNQDEPSEFIKSSRAKRWLKERLIYRYVPAIKAPSYFQYLYGQLHDVLATTYSEQFNESTTQLIDRIQSITEEITNSLEKQLGIKNRLAIPSDLRNFFTSLDFATTINGETFHLANRGDGIKTRHIPVVLKFLADNAKILNKGSMEVTTIWGYEEPENNLEMGHAFELAKTFLEYSEKVQIFTTTHSPAFYSMNNNQKVSCWFLKRNTKNYTTINILNKDTSVNIDEEMGVLPYITPFIAKVNEELKLEKRKIEQLSSKLDSLTSNKKCIIFTEDSGGELEMIKVVAKSNDFKIEEVEFISFEGKANLKSAIHSSKWLKNKGEFSNIQFIIFHIDKDVDGELQKEYHRSLLPENAIIFVTNEYDLDSYFINEKHILELYPTLDAADLVEKIETSINETETKSIEKISDGLYSQLSNSDRANNQLASPRVLSRKANELYNSRPNKYYYGKTVLGRLKGKLHGTIEKGKPFNPYQISSELVIPELKSIALKIWGTP